MLSIVADIPKVYIDRQCIADLSEDSDEFLYSCWCMGSHIGQMWYEFTTGDQEIDRYG